MNININPSKPYLIRSIYDWCIDSDFTPFISVKDYPGLDMSEYIKNGEVVFNISVRAVQDLMINNDFVCFMARFNGVPRKLEIPISAIKSIFAKEVSRGIAFSPDKGFEDQRILNNEESSTVPDSVTYQSKNINRPNLRVIK